MKIQLLRLSFILCLMTTISMAVNAQPQPWDNTWSIGPELGVSFSKFGTDADTDYITGLIFGGFLTYSVQNTHAFTGKILYYQKGARDEASNTSTRLNYIEVPLVARLFFNRSGIVRPNIFGGPSLGFLTTVKGKVGTGEFQNINEYKDSFKTFDLGIGIGLGLNIKLDNLVRFIVDTRYTYGFNDVSTATSYVNNQSIAISAGLAVALGQRSPCRTFLWN